MDLEQYIKKKLHKISFKDLGHIQNKYIITLLSKAKQVKILKIICDDKESQLLMKLPKSIEKLTIKKIQLDFFIKYQGQIHLNKLQKLNICFFNSKDQIQSGFSDDEQKNIKNQFIALLNNCPLLKELKFEVEYNEVFDMLISEYLRIVYSVIITKNTNIEVLHLKNCILGSNFNEVVNISEIKNKNKLKSINISKTNNHSGSYNSVLGLNSYSINQIYSHFDNVQEIIIYDKYYNSKQLKYLTENDFMHLIRQASHLKSLMLNSYSISWKTERLSLLMLANSFNGNLLKLGFSSCKDFSNEVLQEFVSQNSNINTLILDYTNISDEGIITAVDLLRQNLKRISLQNCRQITHRGVEYLVENCQNLEDLNIKSLPIIMKPTIHLLTEYSKDTLKKFRFDINDLDSVDIYLLFQKMKKLKKVNISTNSQWLSEAQGNIFDQIGNLQVRNLKKLDLSYNSFLYDDGLKNIASCFINLQELIIVDSPYITSQGLNYIVMSNLKDSLILLNFSESQFLKEYNSKDLLLYTKQFSKLCKICCFYNSVESIIKEVKNRNRIISMETKSM